MNKLIKRSWQPDLESAILKNLANKRLNFTDTILKDMKGPLTDFLKKKITLDKPF